MKNNGKLTRARQEGIQTCGGIKLRFQTELEV